MQAETNYALHLVSTYDEINERSQNIIKEFGSELQKHGYAINSYENLVRQTVTPGPDIKKANELPKIWIYIINSPRGEKAVLSRFRSSKRTDAIILAGKGTTLNIMFQGTPVIEWNENNLEAIAHKVHEGIRSFPVAEASDFVTITTGSRGELVAAIQQMLIKTVAPKMFADGIYGPSTASAVKLFQKNNKLEITGEVDEQTFLRLEEEARKSDENVAENDTDQNPNYWILKLNPRTWEIENLKPGLSAWFHSYDLQNRRRAEYDLFEQVKTGDLMLGYAFGDVKAICCEFRITEALHDDENLGEGIRFEISRVFDKMIPLKAIQQVLPGNSFLSDSSEIRLIAMTSDQYQQLQSTPDTVRTESLYMEQSRVAIRGQIEPALGVTDVAKELAELINNLDPEDYGKMIGIFGNWGRGKTYLVEQLWDVLETNKQTNYIRVDFHAWKYQDTHASWAYLYEAFAKKYFEEKGGDKLLRMFRGYRKRFRLNVVRHGYGPIIRFVASSLFTIGSLIPPIYFFESSPYKYLWYLLTLVGSTGVVQFLIRFYKEYNFRDKAIDLFKKYYNKPSFKDLLGIQSEIQNELRNLLEAWIQPETNKNSATENEKTVFNKQILLFVDDIDRCSEDRIIQIIDALRVMLDEPDISKRVRVIAAIDERVLKRAIKWKYKELLDADRLLEDDAEWQRITLQITSEYMDKIFLAGIKLGTLRDDERIEIYGGFSKGKVQPDTSVEETETGEVTSPPVEEKTAKTVSKSAAENQSKTTRKPVEPVDQIVQKKGFSDFAETASQKKPEQKDPENKPADTNFDLSAGEDALLQGQLRGLHGVTPRQIRIFYYRYILARNLLTKAVNQSRSASRPTINTRNQLLIQLLGHYTAMGSNEALLKDRAALSRDIKNTGATTIGPFIKTAPPELVSEILEALEMVIAY